MSYAGYNGRYLDWVFANKVSPAVRQAYARHVESGHKVLNVIVPEAPTADTEEPDDLAPADEEYGSDTDSVPGENERESSAPPRRGRGRGRRRGSARGAAKAPRYIRAAQPFNTDTHTDTHMRTHTHTPSLSMGVAPSSQSPLSLGATYPTAGGGRPIAVGGGGGGGLPPTHPSPGVAIPFPQSSLSHTHTSSTMVASAPTFLASSFTAIASPTAPQVEGANIQRGGGGGLLSSPSSANPPPAVATTPFPLSTHIHTSSSTTGEKRSDPHPPHRTLKCNTEKGDQWVRKHNRTAGALYFVWNCGVCFYMSELYGSEGKKQVFYALKNLMWALATAGLPFPMAACYDDACHLVLFLMRRQAMSPLTAILSAVDWVIDRFHFVNHTDNWCKKNLNANHRPVYDDACTECCEGFFSWLNIHGSHLRHSSSNRFGMWTLILCHLRNIVIVGRPHTQRPGSSQRNKTSFRQSEGYRKWRPFVKLAGERTGYYLTEKDDTHTYPSDIVILASPAGAHATLPIPGLWNTTLLLAVGSISPRLEALRAESTEKGIEKDTNPLRREAWRVEYREALFKELLWYREVVKVPDNIWTHIWAYAFD